MGIFRNTFDKIKHADIGTTVISMLAPLIKKLDDKEVLELSIKYRIGTEEEELSKSHTYIVYSPYHDVFIGKLIDNKVIEYLCFVKNDDDWKDIIASHFATDCQNFFNDVVRQHNGITFDREPIIDKIEIHSCRLIIDKAMESAIFDNTTH